MNFTDTLKSVELVLATDEVPLIVGDSGIGKTALAKELARKNNWSLIVIDGNLLKEGEIGGLPTIETYFEQNEQGSMIEKKATIYAVHTKLKEIDEAIKKNLTVLLFIDELNRCEHTVQQELMNLILNREINGYRLDRAVKIIAAMNPSGKYGSDYDYQVVDMDPAQENRFVWLYLEPDHLQWLSWAIDIGLEQKVTEFISTFPEYLHKLNEDTINATPRSYERISKAYHIYKENRDTIHRTVFLNVLKGNVGLMIAGEFLTFVEADFPPLISFTDITKGISLSETITDRIRNETHTRLYLSARNILNILEAKLEQSDPEADHYMNCLIEMLSIFPVDLRLGIMKDIRNSYSKLYQAAIDMEAFVELFFEAYGVIED